MIMTGLIPSERRKEYFSYILDLNQYKSLKPVRELDNEGKLKILLDYANYQSSTDLAVSHIFKVHAI